MASWLGHLLRTKAMRVSQAEAKAQNSAGHFATQHMPRDPVNACTRGIFLSLVFTVSLVAGQDCLDPLHAV